MNDKSLLIQNDVHRQVAADVIDLVEEAIRNAHPQIEKIAQDYTVTDEDAEKTDAYHPNTLLYGEVYYDLEDELANVLREKFSVRRRFWARFSLTKKLQNIGKAHMGKLCRLLDNRNRA
jgi:hypothetical protein